jgi:hypothetical protein
MAEKTQPRVRKLYDWEIMQITPIFLGSLSYEKARVRGVWLAGFC